MRNPRVLVTGANGYLGSAVVEALLTAGHQVVALVRGDRSRVPDGAVVRSADLLDPQALSAAVRDVDAVCHLAALTRVRESAAARAQYVVINVDGTGNLLDAMRAAGIRGLVFASTVAVYGTPDRQPMPEELPEDPRHPYAETKLAAERLIESRTATGDLAASVLRLCNVAGGPDPDPTRILPRILAATPEQPLRVNGDGSVIRDYLHIADAASAFAAAVVRLPDPGGFRRYNIGSGVGTTLNGLIAAIARITGRAIPVEYGPPVAEPPCLISDSTRANYELAWRPTYSTIDAIIRGA
ncbi:NAD-dependent epimerase/dehydratase family protein [Nocardia arthritidis]|uniref:UDP-glucose 4-epimerase n=1 Tax=Nocardia arthritidis TaxID=228602 RepID=A0A6G9YS07_9NOCA|nr:NAD-dependent epimerase/dehydratase family protein [Nocardia arthritidis]QIS15887.1 NAD-dependent epimerase/dehydratase family protein [Nocardia arthritidis]